MSRSSGTVQREKEGLNFTTPDLYNEAYHIEKVQSLIVLFFYKIGTRTIKETTNDCSCFKSLRENGNKTPLTTLEDFKVMDLDQSSPPNM